jgi:hypothetical protein
MKLFTNDDGVFNDLEAAQKVYSLYNHWVYCDETLFVFDDKSGLWSTSEVVMFNIISRYNDNLYLLSMNDEGDIKKLSKGYGNSTTLQRQMLPQLKTLCINNSWLIKNNLSSMNKILFLNERKKNEILAKNANVTKRNTAVKHWSPLSSYCLVYF